MYQIQGDKTAQDEVRNANSQVRHCHLLENESPSYCIDGPDGRGCPNNPYLLGHPLHEIITKTERFAAVINRAIKLEDRHMLGTPIDLATARTTDIAIARVAIHVFKSRERELLGDHIANAVARILS